MNPQKRFKIFEALSKATPQPTTELIFKSPFQLLIAVILSAQATDKSVNKATLILFNKAPVAKKLAQMQLSEIENCIKTIGLYKTKAKNILATAKIIDENYHGEVPQDRIALEALPGVGRKTANVILSFFINLISLSWLLAFWLTCLTYLFATVRPFYFS